MSYRLAYIDEQEASLSNFYSHFNNDYGLIMIKVDANSTIESLLKECFENEVDAIVTDYKLEEEGNVNFNGDKLFDAIKTKYSHFPVIMLTSWEPDAIDHMENVHLIYNKDILDGKNSEEFTIFKSKINSTIKNYYKKIEDTNSRISELVDKRNSTNLEISEEEELTKLYILYDELNPDGKEIPANLIQKESITQLTDFVIEAKEILEELKKINRK